MRKFRTCTLLFATICLFAALVGCGGPNADVNVFIMPEDGITFAIGDKLDSSLQAKMGEALKTKVGVSAIFSMDKLMVELVAAQNGIIILPEKQYRDLIKDGGPVDLSGIINKEEYPSEVVNGQLTGIPVHESKWMKDAGYKGKSLFAFIPVNAPDPEKAKLVLKAIAEK